MSTERMLLRSFPFTFRLSALAVVLTIVSPANGQSKSQADRLIDAMASHNKAPKIVLTAEPQ